MNPSPPVTAFVAFGANLGDRERTIRLALDLLGATPGVRVERASSLLENAAIGGPADSPPYLNGVAQISTTLDAHDLLDRLMEIERQLGRERRQRWAPRTIDLDLILFGDQVISTETLRVPHPLMHERTFVLKPLAEVAPDVVHPLFGTTASELLRRLTGSDER